MERWWRIGAVAPGVAGSTLVVVGFVGPALPATVQVTVFYGGLVVAMLLACGRCESAAVRLLAGARLLTAAEADVMAPVWGRLADWGLEADRFLFYVSRSSGALAAGHGRRSVVVAEELLTAVSKRQVSVDQTAIAIGRAVVVVERGMCRQDPAIWFWTIPTRLLGALVRPLIPRQGILAFAWKIRWMVGGLAIGQSLVSGPPLLGPAVAFAVTLLLAGTYACPWCARRWDEHLGVVGEQAVREMAGGTVVQ